MPRDRSALTIAVLCFGGLSVSLTQTLVVPIQSELPRLLDTSVSNAGWVVTVTLLTAAVTMPISGRVADLVGKQRVLVASGLLLAAGSVVSALSSSLAPMLVGRAVQGMAMGFIPVGIALMREVTPAHLTNTAIAAMSATLGVGGAIGLPLSAFVAQTFDFHALFWMGALLALVLTAGVALAVPHARRTSRGGRLDVPGAIGLTIGLVAVLVAVSKVSQWGWLDARTLGLAGLGVLVLAAWGRFELGRAEPLVDLRVSGSRPVLLTNVAAVAIGFGMMAQVIVMPQLLQLPTETGYGLGQSVLQAGLWMAPGGLMMLVFAPISSRLMTAVGPKRTLMVGASVLAAGYVVAYLLMDAPWQILLASCVASAGVGIGYAAMPSLILGAVPAEQAGSAVGVNSLMRSVGTTAASAVMVTILSGSVTAAGVPSRTAYELCFAAGALAALAGVAVTALVPHVHRRRVETGHRSDLAESPA